MSKSKSLSRAKTVFFLIFLVDSIIFNLFFQVPAGVEKACIIHGGAEWEKFNDIRPDSVISENTGLIFAALRNLQHVVVDINRSLWENLFYEERSITAKLNFVNITPLLGATPSKNKKEKLHLAYNLMQQGNFHLILVSQKIILFCFINHFQIM